MPLFSHTTDIDPSFAQKVLSNFAEELGRKASFLQAWSKALFSISISHFVSVFVFYFSVLFKDKLFAVFLFAWKEVPVCPRNWLSSRSPICARSIWVQPMHSEHLEILADQLHFNLNHLKSASALLLSGSQGQVGATKGGLGAICNYANYSASHCSKVSSLKMSNFSHQAFWMKPEKLQLFCEQKNNALRVNMNCERVFPGPCHLYKLCTWVSQSDSLAELFKLFPSLTVWKPSPPPPSPSTRPHLTLTINQGWLVAHVPRCQSL